MQIFRRSDKSPLAEWWRTVDKGLIAAAFILLAPAWCYRSRRGRRQRPSSSSMIRFTLFIVRACSSSAQRSCWWPLHCSIRSGRGGVCLVLFVVCFFLTAGLLMFGHEAKGATRWIRIWGTTFQPSEIIKPALVVLTAWLLAQRERFPAGPWAPIAFAFYAVTVGLLLLQPDVGQSVLVTAAFVIVFFIAGLPWVWVGVFSVLGAVLPVLLYNIIPHVRFRVNSFLNPTDYDTYQIDKARQAIERGGFFGVGPGEGTVKRTLPDAHTDFVYAVAGEEFGLLLLVALTVLFAVIAIKGIMEASKQVDVYQRAAGVGLYAIFGLQAAVNMSVNLSLIPPKGMTLPLVSSGGSSLLGSALTLGLALALTRKQPESSLSHLRHL